MRVDLCYDTGYMTALLGLGLSYGITSGVSYEDILEDYMLSKREKLYDIAVKLAQKDGGEDKFLRQIVVCLDITAPRYWWTQMDTYKVGTTAQSESTMHTIMKKKFSREDFAIPPDDTFFDNIIASLNALREKQDFHSIVAILPQSYLQRRIWTANYAVLKNIFLQRADHKLAEWQEFIAAVRKQVEYPEFLPCKTQ